MSATKLIIHKFEAGGINFKSLQVVTEDDDSNNAGTKYSDWLDGKIQEKKKDPDKSSRLVVKIVSGNELDKFNLSSSAKEIDAAETNITNFTDHSMQMKPLRDFYKCDANGSDDIDFYQSDISKNIATNPLTGFQQNIAYKKGVALQGYVQNNCSLDNENYLSPLEYSLEKVKENNARIMENIHMLNRTLNYTKKKEILDIVCPKSMRSYPCNTCGKCFVYETGLRRHYSMRHSMTEVQPRWQVVWTCIQCFQVWPRQDQALSHASECCKSNNRDCVREIKTSSLLQCEFCEKVYTSIPRLLRHSKIHTTNNNYECNVCEMAFSSYKIAEQHWVSCPWLKMYYSFSLPKLLLCNACDRKFRNYDQLYNHRYKVGHFMTKTHCNPYSVKSLGILVYQCEMCGAWYPSVAPLKAHKNQYHPKHDIAMQCKMEQDCNDQSCMSTDNDFSLIKYEDSNTQG
ncbi:uncharacterized protein LOC142976039 [Anticarsia gemmatalis]|uniref:uncharacterized protein LOC142976039 n=1 Tax=Anticarsia gemmatalis TaxID=129554 RepID=UPI003F767972